MMMNIGVDIKVLYGGQAGIATYIRNTLDALQDIDCANRYFLFEKQASSYKITNPLFTKILVPSRLPGTLWLMAVLPFQFKKHSIDVFWGPEQVIPCIFPSCGTPMVSTILDLTMVRYPETMQTTNFLINKFFLRKSIRRSERILTISKAIKREILASYPGEASADNIVVTYPGKPRWPMSEAPEGSRGEHLLFVGSFEPRKNLMNLLKALLIVRKKENRTVPLRIVGPPGWKNKAIIRFVKNNGLEGQVFFKGYCTEDELRREYAACKAFIYPSLYEGFGLPVLEALVTQTPVLSSQGTSMEEIAFECIILFDPHDPKDMAEKIMRVYRPDFDGPGLLKGREKVLNRYSWEITARKTLEVLTETFRKKRSGHYTGECI
jgi:glycosyltransferase involved in cell wall biosynthesis